MVNDIDKDAKGIVSFPTFLQLMTKKYSDDNAEDEIRETFRVFDTVSIFLHFTSIPTYFDFSNSALMP